MLRNPVYPMLNVAVLHLASRLFPAGFDVASEAPETLESLKDHVSRTGRMLVWDGASDQTIFGDPEVNYAFRAWHDWVHIKFDLPFTAVGEIKAAKVQCSQIREVYGDGPITDRMCKLIMAEVAGQVLYHCTHGDFPVDQAAFALAYIENPRQAVAGTF